MSNLQRYLDDIFVAGKPDSEECQVAFNRCFQICKQLGVPLANDNTEGPSTCITFLGFEIDSVAQELRLPASKFGRMRAELRSWGSHRSGSKRKLLSLVGRLQHCCQAITLGRPFVGSLIGRAYSVKELYKFVHLTAWEKEDLEWWNSLINNWLGCVQTR